MRNDHRSFSSRRAALLVMTSVMGMSGCSTGTSLLSSRLEMPVMRATITDVKPIATVEKTLKPTIQPAGSEWKTSPELSAWCESIQEDAAAQATIMRSPTLSGSISDDRKSNINLGLSVSSFTKAELIELSAEVKCRRYLAELGLQKLAFIAPQGLTAAGYRAKAKNINGHKKEMAEIRKLVARELQAGSLTKERSTALTVALDELLAEADSAQSQANRRFNDFVKKPQGADVYGRDLLRADAELEDLNSQMRTADAMDLSVQAGWHDSDFDDGLGVEDDSFSGKVSFSVKLGALNPKRFEHERKSKEARARAIQSEEGGTLWQISVLRKAHERAVDGLVEAQVKLSSAIDEADRLVATLRSVSSAEFKGPLIAARLQVMKLKADRAAVTGSINELRANMKSLSTG